MMITPFFHTRFILRLMIRLIIFIMIVCIGVLNIGIISPSTMIVAKVHSPEFKTHLILSDIYRNLSIYFELPSISNIILSPNRRRFVIISVSSENNASTGFTMDIFTGDILHLPQTISDCNIMNWSPDSRYITFSCEEKREEGNFARVYLLDFETDELKLLSSMRGLYINYPQWSPDLKYVVLTSDETMSIVNMDNSKTEIISLDDRESRLIGWLDNETLLVYNNQKIQKYIVITNSFETLLYDLSIQYHPILSPNKNWIGFISNSQAYIFHLSTSELMIVSPPESEIGQTANILGFFNNSTVMLIEYYNDNYSTTCYIFDINKNDMDILDNNILVSQYDQLWSPDKQWLTYTFITSRDRYYGIIRHYNELNTLYEIYHVIEGGIEQSQWSENSNGLAFIHHGHLKYMTHLGEIKILSKPNEIVLNFGFVR